MELESSRIHKPMRNFFCTPPACFVKQFHLWVDDDAVEKISFISEREGAKRRIADSKQIGVKCLKNELNCATLAFVLFMSNLLFFTLHSLTIIRHSDTLFEVLRISFMTRNAMCPRSRLLEEKY